MYFTFEGAVELVMYLGVFVKRTSVNFRLEGVVVEKVVIDSVDFAAPRFSRVEVTARSTPAISFSIWSQTVVLPIPAGPDTIKRKPLSCLNVNR